MNIFLSTFTIIFMVVSETIFKLTQVKVC